MLRSLLIEFKNNFQDQRSRLILELLYGTGMRRAELVNVKIEDFIVFFRQTYNRVKVNDIIDFENKLELFCIHYPRFISLKLYKMLLLSFSIISSYKAILGACIANVC